MVDVQVEFSKKDMTALKRKLGNLKSKAPLVLSRAINRAASNAKTNMGKETGKRYEKGSREVGKNVGVSKASTGNLRALVTSKGEPLKITEYKFKAGTPPKAAVKKGGMKPLDGNPKAFMATMKGAKGGSHDGAYQRYGLGHPKAKVRKTRKGALNKHTVNIHDFYGPAIPSIIKNEETMEIVKKEAGEILQRRLEHEVNNILQGGR